MGGWYRGSGRRSGASRAATVVALGLVTVGARSKGLEYCGETVLEVVQLTAGSRQENDEGYHVVRRFRKQGPQLAAIEAS